MPFRRKLLEEKREGRKEKEEKKKRKGRKEKKGRKEYYICLVTKSKIGIIERREWKN